MQEEKSDTIQQKKSSKTNSPSMVLIFSIVIALFLIDCIMGFFCIKAIIKYDSSRHNNSKCKPKYNTEKQISQENPSNMISYMNDVQQSIKKNWNPPSKDMSKRTVLLFKVKYNGDLINYKILETSGDNETDKAAIEALKSTAPFKPFPKDFKEDTVDVQFAFDYNVYKNNTKVNKD